MAKEVKLFHPDWLLLDKKDFRLLVMLTDLGGFSGTVEEICDYFHLNRNQHKNKQNIRQSIQALKDKRWLNVQQSGRKYTLSINHRPSNNIVLPPGISLSFLLQKDYEGVSWEVVLKVYLRLLLLADGEVISQADIGADVGASAETVGNAISVLRNHKHCLGEIEAVYQTKKEPNGKTEIRRQGSIYTLSAFPDALE